MDNFSGVKSNTGLCIGCKFSYCWKRDKGIHVDECTEYTPKNKEPSDMVKVIRCKDCKHWDKRVVSGEWPDKVTCACKIVQHFTQKGWTRYTAPDDYCSFAEMEEDK